MRRLTEEKIVLASHNAGKLREIGDLLAPHGIEVVSAGSLGLAEPDETENTFAGNARLKAHFAAKASSLPALSDDSGLSVVGLDGAPGVYTADWAETGSGRDFPMAMTRVWRELTEKDLAEPWFATFHCTLCLAWPDGHDEIYPGEVNGRLTWPMRGDQGFGFDPMFIPNGHERTFGEMPYEEKAPISHRADAFAKFTSAALGL
ncbi:MAG: RdgB/HAM1 family non-canonical purine NTP pyrophosphatase [Rhodobacteraceae bacterium]|nr:RdgB/HAM1 family non-canonical purine NTP pyrophosphatase [Paracoccaceae bacterium]